MGLCSPGRVFPNLVEMMHGYETASQPPRNDAWFRNDFPTSEKCRMVSMLLPNLGEVA